MPEVATVLQMPRLWPQTIGMPNESQSQQGSEKFEPVGQSNQKKTRAMVARSHEDVEEAFKRGVNVERPRSSGNSKKSISHG